ncbi:MAG: hypothetical protein IPL65_17580 [Lewinellaceae bacterium]|nr:hypothetical protein [Lewinellaceae bacterium]
MIDFIWVHGSETWFLYTYTDIPSTIVKDPVSLYDYNLKLNVTTKKYESTAYQIRGKIMKNVTKPNGAAFAALYEGTGVTWMAANGFLVK